MSDTVEAAEVNLDDLFTLGVEMDSVKEVQEAELLPVGMYLTVPPAIFTLRQFEANNGRDARLIGRVFAAVTPRGEGRGGRVGFPFSPNKVLRDDGRPDRSSMNYAQLVGAYKVAYGENPKTLDDLRKYVDTYPLVLRVIQVGVQEGSTGEPGNLVVGIGPVRG